MKRPVVYAVLLFGVSLVALVPLIAPSSAFAAGNGGNNGGGQAAVNLVNASAKLSQTSDTQWTLKKTGAVDTSGQTVTWTVTATQGGTASGHLTLYGFMTVLNSGAKPATIGNIVVNLQAKSGSAWKTQASDIADATHGDNATSAFVDPKASSENESEFTTGAGSGKLDFMDANNNTVFSLQPEKTIAPGATVNLLFSAGFDNNTLKLSNGAAVRAEVIVSFGNSGSNPTSSHNVDINGNGAIDPDEAWVRSIPVRLGLTVPAEVAGNQSVTLTDTASDIATTGTVTFSNSSFTLGATSGTVMVSYDGGASGGKLTNCAYLKSASSTVTVGSYKFPNVNGINLQACDTEDIGAAATAGWNNGDFTTYNQTEWGGDSSGTSAADLLTANFSSVYADAFGELIVGWSSKFVMSFGSPSAIFAYLPQTGPAGALDSGLADPTTSASGKFGGDVVALQLNVDFSDGGLMPSSSGLKFGDLTMCSTGLSALNGASVRQFLGAINTLLGGGTSSYGAIADLQPIAFDLNGAFLDGTPSTFAQEHLFNGACPVWKNGDLTTYNQTEWGGDSSITTAADLLTADFNSVYAPDFGVLIVGSTFTLTLDNTAPIFDYLPQTGTPGALTATVNDPTNTASGGFGGDVVALKLNVDFADSGLLTAQSGLKFGDLMICGLTSDTDLNGKSVRQFLAIANTALGGGAATDSINPDLETIASDLNFAFLDGPSTWAQQHLRNSACP